MNDITNNNQPENKNEQPRADDGVIRLISARKATRQEATYYQR